MIKIGGIALPVGAGLAPMAGITDLPARRLAYQHGAAFSVSEMLSAKGYLYAPPDCRPIRDLMAASDDSGLCGLQLFGSDPHIMREAASRLSDAGFDFIDINMGCPAPKITGNGEGSALMRTPHLAARVAGGAVAGARIPVTVKIRSGWDEAHINAVEISKMLEDAGAAAITVHARTRAQMYSGRADRSVIARVKKAVSIPVFGNGDVASGADALDMLRETGCDGVMVGRAARGNPWIFGEIRAALSGDDWTAPSVRERLEMAVRHLFMAAAFKGEAAAVREMRGHLPYYLSGLPGCAPVRAQISRMESAAEGRRVLLEYLSRLEA